jgi:hypothetical protein
MPRIAVPIFIADISNFARRLAAQLDSVNPPSHVQFLNIIARAAEHKNYQALLANQKAQAKIEAKPATREATDFKRVEAALRCFDDEGVMQQWPAKHQTQTLCLWALWASFPRAETIMTEKEVNALLNKLHTFRDAALLRRELWAAKLISRDQDCSNYLRLETAPQPEARELIRQVSARLKSAAVRRSGLT